MPNKIVAHAEHLLAGTFLARATYGAEYIAEEFWVDGDDDAEKADDYRGYVESQGWQLLDRSDLPGFNTRNGDAEFTTGGLYNARVTNGLSNSFDAQGLLAVEGGDTLVLAFRGTDGKDPAVETGQAFTGAGIAAHYKAFKPLINAAYQYLKDHPDITEIVVSGHSLGGAMADVFALADAARFRDLRPDGVTIVSLGSSGVPPDLPLFLDGIDPGTADIDGNEILSLVLPPDYFAISNTEDRAHFPNDFPDIPEDFGLIPIAALKNNLQFGGETLFDVPNIENSDVQYYDIGDHPFDFRGMGAEHNSALLWANLQGLVADDLFQSYSGQRLMAGITDYNAVPDYNGTPIALFLGYLKLDSPTIMNDRGDRSLVGTQGDDYILGLAGQDRIFGRGGSDLVSGGTGDDTLFGGNGADLIAGGLGRDELKGEAGRDRFVFTAAEQSEPGNSSDVIRDFAIGFDRIDVSAIDADAGTANDQDFTFIGTAGFTAEAQIRAIQVGADTLLRFNISDAAGSEMEIILRNTQAAALNELSFIL